MNATRTVLSIVTTIALLLVAAFIAGPARAQDPCGDFYCDYPFENHENCPEDCTCRCAPERPYDMAWYPDMMECMDNQFRPEYEYCEYFSEVPEPEPNCHCHYYEAYEFYLEAEDMCLDHSGLGYTDCTYMSLSVACDSCADCTAKLDGRFREVRLARDIRVDDVASDVCIEFGASHVTFDGDGHTITGSAEQEKSGILAEQREGITIENCVLRNFGPNPSAGYMESAIRLVYTSGSRVLDNTIHFGSDGIYLEGSSFNEIRKNVVLDSGYMGIPVLYGSNHNHIVFNRVERAVHVGIASCLDVTGNIIEHNTVLWGYDEGICLCGDSVDNILNFNFVCFNQMVDICVTPGCSGTGDYNRCDTTIDWRDEGEEGCTYACETQPCRTARAVGPGSGMGLLKYALLFLLPPAFVLARKTRER